MRALFEARDTTHRMRLAAGVFLENLRPDQRARAIFPFEAEQERRDWDFVPKYGRNGLPLRDLNHRQQTLAHQLIATGVSLHGYTKVLSIMAMEHVLREKQMGRMGLPASDHRSPGNYFLSFFNWPNHEMTWGWRVVGHHISLNFTIVDGFWLASTPLLLGNEPAEFGVIHPLRDDEDLGFDLLHALGPDLQPQAIIHDIAPPDFVTRVVPRIGEVERPEIYELGFEHYRIGERDRDALRYVRAQPRGVAGEAFDGEQMRRLTALIESYVNRLPEEAANREMDRLRSIGLNKIHFAWAGFLERGRPHYYRLQGPDFLVEFENVQANGNHIHTVMRNPGNDFGDDILARHHRQDHQQPVVVGRVTSTVPAATGT